MDNYFDAAKTACSYGEELTAPWFTLTTETTVLAVIAIFLVTYVWVIQVWPRSFEGMRDESCPLPLPPGTMGFPFLGESLDLIKKGSDFFAERFKRYGPVYKTHIFGKPTVRVIGASNLQPVLMGEHITVFSQWPENTRLLIGTKSLLSITGDEHRLVKHAIAATFAPTILASFVTRLQDVVRRHVKLWCEESEKKNHVLAFPACQNLVSDATLEVILGKEGEPPHKNSLLSHLRTLQENVFSFVVRIPGTGFWKGSKARNAIVEEIRRKLTSDRFQTANDDCNLVQHMHRVLTSADIWQGNQQQIIEDNAVELLVASFFTTSSALCSALLAVGRQPEVLAKIEECLERHGLMEKNEKGEPVSLTYDIIMKLDYVHRVVMEVLRLFPPAGAGFRQVKKTLQIGGFQIPRGWTVAYSIRETHQTSDVFEDPKAFCPDRWLAWNPKELKQNERFSYLPYGLGARQCPGRRLANLIQAVFLVEVVRHCRWRLVNPEPQIVYLPVTKAADNLPTVFRLREHGECTEVC